MHRQYLYFSILLLVIFTLCVVHAEPSFFENSDHLNQKWSQPERRHLGSINHLGLYDDNASIFSDPGNYDERDERLLSIFTWVQFANGPCSVGGQSGTCFTAKECTDAGGTSIGSCARGFGTCCYREITCGGTSSMNCTHLVSPNYPGTYNEPLTCQMTFTRMSGICQLRMDFVEFESFQPTEEGVCEEDQFSVDGERKFQFLCGNSPSNWHFYLDVNGQANPTVFNFVTSAVSFGRKFKIKISMIECRQRVPGGCGQYFTGDTGILQSFNYGGWYPDNQNYGICLRKEKNRCKTTYTRVGPTFVLCFDLFRVPTGVFGTGMGTDKNLVPYCNLLAFTNTRTFPSPQTSVSNGPATIWFRSGSSIAGGNPGSPCPGPACEAGFYLSYEHIPC